MSGLVDVEDAGAAAVLLKAVPDLTPGNRKFALEGMLRTTARAGRSSMPSSRAQ